MTRRAGSKGSSAPRNISTKRTSRRFTMPEAHPGHRLCASRLTQEPGFTAAVTLSLALGIGANTAVFSLIDAVMWRMLPVKNPERVLLLAHRRGPSLEGGFTYQQFRLMREQNKVSRIWLLCAGSPQCEHRRRHRADSGGREFAAGRRGQRKFRASVLPWPKSDWQTVPDRRWPSRNH